MTLDPLRFSRVKLVARSPLHYRHATVEQSLAMERGSAVHSLLLGGDPIVAWTKESANGNPCPRRGKEYDAFVADLDPKTIVLTATAFAEAHAIAEAVKANPLAMRALDGEHEVETKWRFGNRDCAGRIDAITKDGVTELKVSQTADPARFIWHALRMAWLSQDVWYLDGLTAAGRVLEQCRIVAVEPTAPFAVTTFRLTEHAVERARRTYRAWVETILVCESCDEWPAYAQGEVELDVPDNDVALDFGDAALPLQRGMP